MPRAPRLELPNIPMHVTQRGVNRCALFIDDDDRHHFRYLIGKACLEARVALHAFVLMDNHVPLLLCASECGSISQVMRSAGQVYVQAFNSRHRRSGTLFQGRFKSCLVDSDAYVLNVIRYIELNPVRARLASKAEEWRWSSVHSHVRSARDPIVTLHALYLAMGVDRSEREDAYRRWLSAGISDDELFRIRQSMAQERSLGDERFRQMVERALNRPASCRPCGRPRRASLAVDRA